MVREASRRVLRMRHFDVQLIGGMVLHGGKMAEMRTGEGKTLTATLPLLPERPGRQGRPPGHRQRLPGPARRRVDGPALRLAGPPGGRRSSTGSPTRSGAHAYGCDITYATNNEIGFDYLRDNMKWALEDFTQRGFIYAIVDEVDSILIDEARTPLIIAGTSEEDTSKYFRIDAVDPQAQAGRATSRSTRRTAR